MFKKFIGRMLAKYSPILYRKIQYSRMYGKVLNLKKPETLHEKLFWMELNTDTTQWTLLTDKVTARDYIKKCGLEHTLNEVYAVYCSPKEIDFNSLPDSFVMKMNNGGGGSVFIVKDKKTMDKYDIIRQISKAFKEDYGMITAQKHYSRITPKIIVEKLLSDNDNPDLSMTDYKIFCFHGNPVYINVMFGRNLKTHEFQISCYDINWNKLPYDETDVSNVPRPSNLEEMLDISRTLSKPFPFVRVDLYSVKNNVIFGEMTFTPGAIPYNYYDKFKMGSLIHLTI